MSVYGKHGILVRILYLTAAILWYLVTLGGRRASKQIIVLCYHGIPVRHREKFRRQMEAIRGRTFSPPGIHANPCPRKDPFPGVCITFDDAFANLLDGALPILEQYQIPATVFAVSGNMGKKPNWAMPIGHPESDEPTMTPEQLFALSRHPRIRIGSHTVTHPDLTGISNEQVQTELTESKRQIESLLNCPVEDLALPHGAYNPAILELAQKAGYKRIYTLESKPVFCQQSEGVFGRFSMLPDVWLLEFKLTTAGAYAWLSVFRRWIRSMRQRKQAGVL
jgi:peptidoglycan/xylan/chitin deacetylase (PgdA/CDA1 family)